MSDRVPPRPPRPRPGGPAGQPERPWYGSTASLVVVIVLVVLLLVLIAVLVWPDAQDELVVEDPTPNPTVTTAPTPTAVTPAPTPSPTTPTPTATTPTPTPTETATTPTATPSPTEAGWPADVELGEGPPPVQHTGSGDAVETFEHEGGLLLVRVAHRGDGAFTLAITDPDGAPVEADGLADGGVLFAGEGEERGSRALGLPAGDYAVAVTSDAEWGVALEQPVFLDGPALPGTVDGAGDTASGPLRTPGGMVRAEVQVDEPADGGGDIRLRVLDVDGAELEVLEVADGDVVTFEVPEGLFLLDAETDAEVWRVSLS